MSDTMDMARREPGDIRASDSERFQVVAKLQAACVEGRLDLDEYGQRVEDALVARTRAQLEALLIDLPAETAVGLAPSSRAGVSTTVAILSSAHRNGFWRLAEASRVISVLGSSRSTYARRVSRSGNDARRVGGAGQCRRDRTGGCRSGAGSARST